MKFSGREVRDLLVAWLALGVAFTFFFERDLVRALMSGGVPPVQFGSVLVLSLTTAGVAFLLHELAHKVVAVRFGQLAEFRADYGMLFLAVAGGLAGFLFAAPGAVYHQGRSTLRENGLIALAGPVTNVALGFLFLPLVFVGGFVTDVGYRGAQINFILAGFNMLPWGPLDGNTVRKWSTPVFVAVLVPTVLLALFVMFPTLFL
ncbi:zinc metalloprotease [Halomicrococcus gelatinilyticus]|uniref:metalloprotease n=1 Tax=Halomicrococcus gelatinilyticus TaxID=1702103 RepID=UPI002E0D1B26